MSMATSADKWGGNVKVEFMDTVANPDVARATINTLKADVINLEGPADVMKTYEFADGSERETKTGVKGTLTLAFEEFDATLLATLTTYKPGATDGINAIKITFLELGNGSNTYVTISGVSSMAKSLLSGDFYKLQLVFTISGAASDDFEDLVVFTQP